MKRTTRIVTRAPRTATRGFSIVELLVVISIIGLLLAIVFPVISVMTSSSRVQAGTNIVGMASDVARQWVQAEAWANDASTQAPVRESYSGTAALVCPTGEIRIVKNARLARTTSGSPPYLEDRGNEINGYEELSQVDYIKIPNGVGIAGIVRTGPNANDVRFIAPPFAIAFNELGQLNYGDTNGYIYYDANGNGDYEINKDRASISGGYNPFDWRGYDSADNAGPISTTVLKKALPFEAIECVPGVVVYSQDEFAEAGFSFSGGGVIAPSPTAGTPGNWLQENGQTVFFSPHTGTALTDEKQE